MDSKNYISDLIDKNMFHVMDQIFSELAIEDAISLAAMNSKSREAAYICCNTIRFIAESKQFDFDLISEIVSSKHFRIIEFVFPDIERIKIDLRTTRGKSIPKLNIFKNLRKISAFLTEYRHKNYMSKLSIENVSVKQQYFTVFYDALADFLRQLKNVQKLSVLNGRVTKNSIKTFSQFPLIKLKLRNTFVECSEEENLVDFIFNCKSLKKLHLTCEHYSRNPECFYITELFLLRLPEYPLNIEVLAFTLESKRTVPYENLKYLKKLTNVEIYYAAQTSPRRIPTIMCLAKLSPSTTFTLIEYIERPLFKTRATNILLRRSSISFIQSYNFHKELYDVPNISILPIRYDLI